ncbi:MAG: type I phosphomannose isomerase catalytic subunit [Christensenellales bacterium]|jgi:mannose-6-phosphate isomerase
MADFFNEPLELVHNKFHRSYQGGRETDRFRGIPSDQDDGRPESWVGSCTLVSNAAQLEDKNTGYAEVITPKGEKLYLKDLLKEHPEGYLGEAHVKKYGDHPMVLVKILDAGEDLALQAHPPKEIAQKLYNLPRGKHECWYVLGTRDDVENPSLTLGFKEGITKETYYELFDKQDIGAMLDWCHKIPVEIEDMYDVPNGLVHAIGKGCFIIEVQEPSDVTAVVEKSRAPQGRADDPAWREQMLEAFNYEGLSQQGIIDKYKVAPVYLQQTADYAEKIIIGKAQGAPFGAARYDMSAGVMDILDTGTFSILIVAEGEGIIRYDGGERSVKKGDEVFLPAGLKDVRFATDGKLSVIRCFPPDAV